MAPEVLAGPSQPGPVARTPGWEEAAQGGGWGRLLCCPRSGTGICRALGCASGSPSPWQLRSVVPAEERESTLPLPSLPLPTPPSGPPSLLHPCPAHSSSTLKVPRSVCPVRLGGLHAPGAPPRRHGLPVELRAGGGALSPWACTWRTSGGLGGGSTPATLGPRSAPLDTLFLKGNFLLELSQPKDG